MSKMKTAHSTKHPKTAANMKKDNAAPPAADRVRFDQLLDDAIFGVPKPKTKAKAKKP